MPNNSNIPYEHFRQKNTKFANQVYINCDTYEKYHFRHPELDEGAFKTAQVVKYSIKQNIDRFSKRIVNQGPQELLNR